MVKNTNTVIPDTSKKRKVVGIALRVLTLVVCLVVLLYAGLAWYIHTHKKETLAMITSSLNENISGSITIGAMETTFLRGFPSVSLRLTDVVVRDSLFDSHKHTLLKAGYLDVAVNAFALLRGTVEIKKITIANAAADIFTDANGYTNTSVFRNKKKTPAGEDANDGGLPELRKLELDKVSLTANNVKTGKLYNFEVHSLFATIDYKNNGWQADISLGALAKSMAFNTARGSFIKDQEIDGRFDITYNDSRGALDFKKMPLIIGGDKFTVGATLYTGNSSKFEISIENPDILWKDAANLLSPNITQKLMMFDIKQPISVACGIKGDFNDKGDPLIEVAAGIKKNTLITPGGTVDGCSFNGSFTNRYNKQGEISDENSAITLTDFRGSYNGVPFTLGKAMILNLDKPIATGDFASSFIIEKLKNFVDDDLLTFSKGTAVAKLNFKADVVNFKLAKPFVEGSITVKDADITYVPRKLRFNNISVALNFTKDDLNISRIVLKTDKSIVNMNGHVGNFLNLYYSDPEKIVLEWQIYSPKLYLEEYISFLQTRKETQKKIQQNKKGNFTDDMSLLFEKSSVDMKLKVDNVYYKKFHATNATANVLLTEQGNIVLKNAGLHHEGGQLSINGSVYTGGSTKYNLLADVKSVNVSRFLDSFENFGMQSLTGRQLKGIFSATADVSGILTEEGNLLPKSINGNVTFTLKKARLINFEPIVSVGKFAFPFRDVKNIEFDNLKGHFDIKGEKITVAPMQINSSLINMDVEGTYSFGRGTKMFISVPLRNPERDKHIKDEKELAKRRNRGIVVHLIAEDEADGKVKIKLGKKY
ncbi:AsmA-like C-terminal region-containing protein [Flavobacterium sp. RHBU_24]|uniref:AsmA-like C-terminal region-containing protein n=1 Tax=Flavobacterium sp. RHBU_24 TaxID=3391185 RepID=UPI0039850736